jgi:hypothetical protein
MHDPITNRDPPTKKPAISLSGADFGWATLQETFFGENDLREADFSRARLANSKFAGTDLARANFTGAILLSVNFEPKGAADLPSMRFAYGIYSMTYSNRADALLELRALFKSNGRRDLERIVTYAIERTKTSNLLENGRWPEGYARYVGWDVPTNYDLEPGRALFALVKLVLVFAFLYWVSLANSTQPRIWKVLPGDRLNGNGQIVFVPIRANGLERVRVALLFSVFSAFQLGWRDLNVGAWLSRLCPSSDNLRQIGSM